MSFVPAVPGPSQISTFLDRYASVFGRSQATVLRLAGLGSGEHTAQGAFVVDEAGRTWTDFGSFGLHLLGHRHPAIVASLLEQIGRMGLSTRILGNTPAVQAAERLIALSGGDKDTVLFANSGSEAVEIALKLACLTTGRSCFVALRNSYHGRTAGALAVSAGYTGRGKHAFSSSVTFVTAEDDAEIDRVLGTRDVAGVIIEPVQGEGGIRPLSDTYIATLTGICRQYGALLIADEIQSGLGRSGRLLSAGGADVILFGKSLGGGVLPVSAAVFSSSTCGATARDPLVHASSFAASPLAGAVASAVLETVGAVDFLPRVALLGAAALSMLTRALADCPEVVEIRGRGLMIGIEFVSAAMVGETILEAARRGVLVAFCLGAPTVLRVYPPAVVSDGDLGSGIRLLIEAVRAARASCTRNSGETLVAR